ncbi:MAG: serine hydrolase [Bacteroidales bacterium]|nr:serine hydrolase [Bacteroidales bacterium]
MTFAVSMLLLMFAASSCNNPSKEEVANQKLGQILEETGAVGLAVAVVKDGEVVFSNTYGKRSLETDRAIAQDDIFRIASISKSFTTTALMTLIEKGEFSLDSDVSDLVGFTVRNPRFPETVITLKMLLSHSSSMNDSQGYFSLDTLNPETNPEYAKCYNEYEPGTKYEYCNLGFNTIGAITEKYAKVRFDNFVAETVLKPMGLNANFNPDQLDRNKFVPLYTYYQADTVAGTEAGFRESTSAYISRADVIDSAYVMGYSTPVFSPTGGMKISAYDLARYMSMHMNKGTDPVSGAVIISPESSSLMQKPVIETGEGEHYCLALRTTENLIPGELMTGHTGSAYGLFSAMFFEPQKGFGFVMITNGYDPKYEDGFTVIQRDVIRALYDVFVK